MQPILLPWSLIDSDLQGDCDYDLTIHVPATEKTIAWIATTRVLDRTSVIKLCQGRGVELGPGPIPRILNSNTVHVSYIEQTPPAEWHRMYNKSGNFPINANLWEHYIVGNACDIPFEDGTLDFIFSSHVFEHLANPLGHLEIWARKLKLGGHVVAMIPDYLGTKDFPAEPATIDETMEEYRAANFEPTRQHYRRYAAIHNIKDQGERLWKEGASIHVHAYTRSNIDELLRNALSMFGFRDFSILHTPNHKEFFFRILK